MLVMYSKYFDKYGPFKKTKEKQRKPQVERIRWYQRQGLRDMSPSINIRAQTSQKKKTDQMTRWASFLSSKIWVIFQITPKGTCATPRSRGERSIYAQFLHSWSLTAHPWQVSVYQKERIVFQPSFFRGCVSFKQGNFCWWKKSG